MSIQLEGGIEKSGQLEAGGNHEISQHCVAKHQSANGWRINQWPVAVISGQPISSCEIS